jgi:tRNA threonylcarbamoyladenosine biosynthesis protein TsaB
VRLLAIETATDACSIALMEDGVIVADAALFRPRQQAAHLAPLVASLLGHCEWQASDLDAIAVSSGPGSYTGLRIGVSTAKGLAMASSAAVVAVPTLEAFAMRALPRAAAGDTIMPLFDARRESVYAGVWHVRPERALECILEASAFELPDLETTLRDLDGTVHLLGDGAQLIAEVGISIRHADLLPHASTVAHLGWRMFNDGIVADLASFEPDYMREFVAKTPARSAFSKLGF